MILFKVIVILEGKEVIVEGNYSIKVNKDLSDDITLEVSKIYDSNNTLYDLDLIDDDDFIYDLMSEVYKLIDNNNDNE